MADHGNPTRPPPARCFSRPDGQVLNIAAEGISKSFSVSARANILAARRYSEVSQPVDSPCSVRKCTGRIDRRAVFVSPAPLPDRVEIFQGEAQGIHPRMTSRTRRILAVLLHPFTDGCGGLPGSPSFRSGTSGGGCGGGVPRRLSSTHLPRKTGDVRLAYEVTVRMLP